MNTRNLVNLSVAVTGTGKTSERLAIILAYANHDVFVGARDEDISATRHAFRFFDNITVTSIEDAAASSDVVIIAGNMGEVREMAYFIDEVKDKVVIDYSSYAGGYTGEYLDTLNAIQVITRSQQVVKCYSSDGYKKFISPMLGKDRLDMFMIGDNKKSKVIAKIVFDDLGFATCRDFGGGDAVKLLDAITTDTLLKPLAPNTEKELVPVSVNH